MAERERERAAPMPAKPDKCQICLCRKAVWLWRAVPGHGLRLCQWTVDRMKAKRLLDDSELEPFTHQPQI